MPKSLMALLLALILFGAVNPATADDWINSGGDAGRNGLSSEIGPTGAEPAWSGGRSSLIAWLPVTEGERAFMVRQPRWPDQQPNDAYVVASTSRRARSCGRRFSRTTRATGSPGSAG